MHTSSPARLWSCRQPGRGPKHCVARSWGICVCSPRWLAAGILSVSRVQKATAVSTVVIRSQGEPAAQGNADAFCLAARDRSRRYIFASQLIAVVQHGAADWSSPRCMCSGNQAAASEPQYPARCAHSQCVSSIVSGGCQCIAE